MTTDGTGIKGTLNVKLTGPDGKVKVDKTIKNLITTVGDQYYAKMAIVGVAPASASAPTLACNMQLGASGTAVAKSGTGSKVEGFIASTGVAFDATYPKAEVVSGDTGWKVTYRTTFGAGVGTATIQEAVITTETGSNTASVEAKTIARVLTGSIVKGSADTLTLTWVHTFFDNPA